MPDNPKSKENLKKGEATRFSGETAAKNGRKGGTISGQEKRAAQKELEISIHAPRAGRGVKANKNPLSALYNYNKKTPVFQQ